MPPADPRRSRRPQGVSIRRLGCNMLYSLNNLANSEIAQPISQHRQMKNELDTLRKVEDLQHDSAEDARKFLQENARDSARRRAISGIDNRQALLLAQRERNTAVLRHTAGHPGALLSPNMAMLSSPAMSSMPIIHVPQSPDMLGAGLHQNYVATPRVRTVSALHTPVPPSLGGYHGSPGLGLPLARPRAISSAALGGAATVERVRLEERKRALLQKEAMLQAGRQQRLMEKKSLLDLDAQELALRRKAQEMDARVNSESRERMLDGQEAQLQQRQREQMLEHEMEERLRHLSVNVRPLLCRYSTSRIASDLSDLPHLYHHLLPFTRLYLHTLVRRHPSTHSTV
jgi:hypothetical protein